MLGGNRYPFWKYTPILEPIVEVKEAVEEKPPASTENVKSLHERLLTPHKMSDYLPKKEDEGFRPFIR